MRIQEALTYACEGIRNLASTAATWIGKAVSVIGSTASATCSKVAQVAQSLFQNLGTIVQNRPIASLGVAVAAGAIAATVAHHVFCRGAAAEAAPVAAAPEATVATA